MIIFCKTSEGTFMVDGITSLFYQQMMTDDDQRERIQRFSKFIEKRVKDIKKLKDNEDAFETLISEIVEEYGEELDEEIERKDFWAVVEKEVNEWVDKVPDEIHYFWDESLSGEASVIEVEYRRSDNSLGKLVTTYDVFICNDEGKTIHHLSPRKGD